MKKVFLVSNIWRFVEAAILIAIGGVTIIFAGNANFKWIIGLVASIAIIVDGVLNLLFYFFRVMFGEHRTGLVTSIGEITIGIFLIVVSSANKTFVVDNFTLLIALLLVVLGSALSIEAIAKIVGKRYTVGGLIVQFIVGVLAIALGIVSLVFLNTAVDVLLIITGVILIVAGLLLVFTILLALYTAYKAGKTVKEFFESDYSATETIKDMTGQNK